MAVNKDAVDAIKKDINALTLVLTHYGYEEEKPKLVMGVSTIIFKLPDQKSGCLFVWQGSDQILRFHDYGPYVDGGGSIIDFVIKADRLSSSTDDFFKALKTISDITRIDLGVNSTYNSNEALQTTIQRFNEIAKIHGSSDGNEQSKLKILLKSTQFKMENVEQYFPRVAEYLKSRKIFKISKLEIYKTSTEIQNQNSEGHKDWIRYMVGIPYGFSTFYTNKDALKTIPASGIELRETRHNAINKTRSFKENDKSKTPSMILSQNRKILDVFESYFDYMCLQTIIDHSKTDIAVLNGTGLAIAFAENMLPIIAERDRSNLKTYDTICMYVQNDIPGIIAILKILPNLVRYYPNATFLLLGYKKDEIGLDVNDLMIKQNLSQNEVICRLQKFVPTKLLEVVNNMLNQGFDYKQIVEYIKPELATTTSKEQTASQNQGFKLK